MDAIISFLTGIVDFVTGVIDFVIRFISDTVYIIQLTGEFLTDIPGYFAWLPSEVLVIVVSIFGIVVIYKVLGREG